MEKCGKCRKQWKMLETTGNVRNNGKCRKQWKTSETMENVGNNGTTENIGNIGIGTGGNMVHDTIQTCILKYFHGYFPMD